MSLPKPFYEDGSVTIYHGDCREILPNIEPSSVDLLLTDPPYGMDYKPLRGANGSKMWGKETVDGDAEEFDPSHLLSYPRLILFGAQWFAHLLPPSGGWLVWDKTPSGIREGFIYSHAELAWTNLSGRISKYALEWQGNVRNHEQFLHPTQKPVAMMRWLIEEHTSVGDQILDPYMGSGPIAQAAKETGRRYVGCELHERYCEIAAERCSQEVFDLGEAA